MARLDARVGKLEAQLGATSPRVVVMFAEAGDSYTDGIRRHGHAQATNIRNAFPGVTLSAQGKPGSEVFAVTEHFNARATTGSLVFGQSPAPSVPVPTGWDENLGLLRAEFSSPASYVQVDLIFDDDDIASLWAYGSNGDLLGTFTAAGDGRNPVRFTTASITRPGFDIAYILAGGNVAEAVSLDNLQVRDSDVPEPATVALLGLGLVGVAALRRTRLS